MAAPKVFSPPPPLRLLPLHRICSCLPPPIPSPPSISPPFTAMLHQSFSPSPPSSPCLPPSRLPLPQQFIGPSSRSLDGGMEASAWVPYWKLDFTSEVPQLKSSSKPGNRCCSFQTVGSRTGIQDRNLFLDHQEPNLIDIEESSNGFVLFKFGMPETYDQSMGLLSLRGHAGDSSTIFPGSLDFSEVIHCPAAISRQLEGSQEVLNKLSCNVAEEGINFTWSDSTSFIGNSFQASYGLKNSQETKNDDESYLTGRAGWVRKSGAFCKPAIQGSSFLNCDDVTGSDGSEDLYLDSVPINSDPNKQLGLPPSIAKVLARVSGCSSLGIYGSDFITKIGSDGMDFLRPRDMEFSFSDDKCIELHGSYMTVMMMAIKRLHSELDEVQGKIKPRLSTQVSSAVKSSTTKRVEKVKKKNGSRKMKYGKAATHARDLFRRNSFQLYEVIFCYPFMNSSEAALNFQTIPKESLLELVAVFNQIAVGLAGGGLALVLFVASRMLSVNATLDSSKILYLVRGIGLLWLSSAVQKFGGIIRHMEDVCTKARSQRKEHLAKIRTELQAMTFKAFTLVALSVFRLV